MVPVLRLPVPQDGTLFLLSRKLDGILAEAAQDLGLTVISEPTRELAVGDDDLVALAARGWVVSPRLWTDGESLRLRIVAVAPRSNVLLTRSRPLTAKDLELSAVVMLRDVVVRSQGEQAEPPPKPASAETPTAGVRSEGRAVLAIHSAAFGAYVGFAVQRASGSDDPRLMYPLMALGTGVGFGASMMVADEWPMGVGAVWYLSAGTWWPGGAAYFLATSYGVPSDDRHAYAVLGAAGGLSLGALGLTFASPDEGDAAIAHSGGALGMLLGGLGQLIYEGRSDVTPERGMGYGAGTGVLLGGILATKLAVPPARVLMVDIGASLGALAGAAAASPTLLVDDNLGEGGNRIWLSSVALGTLIGGGLSVWLTAPTGGSSASAAGKSERLGLLPYFGVLGETRTPAGSRVPALGGGVRGVL